jgi:hypothetical protein
MAYNDPSRATRQELINKVEVLQANIDATIKDFEETYYHFDDISFREDLESAYNNIGEAIKKLNKEMERKYKEWLKTQFS